MNLVYVGKIVNTHGLKGELRILSTFSFKPEIFKPDFTFYVEGIPYIISSYRQHKNYDMVTFKGFSNIDDVLFLKGKDVYMNRDDIGDDIILSSDLIGMNIFSSKGSRGTVKSILDGVRYDYLEVLLDDKIYYIPNLDVFIKNVDKVKKEIHIDEIEGLIDEN